MQIGGFQSISMNDYPGRCAAVIYCQGCNFRCGYCHNHSLIAGSLEKGNGCDQYAIMEKLEKRERFIDSVVVSGGEPTIQPDLQDFIEMLVDRRLKVKLDTNGSRPGVIEDLLKANLLDFVAMDIKSPIEKYGDIIGVDIDSQTIKDSIEILLKCHVKVQFRTTYIPKLHVSDDIDVIRNMLPIGADYKIQTFIPENAMDISLRS